MTTNSADTTQLLGFAQSLDGIAAATSSALEQTAWAMARYQRECADLPVESSATGHASDALDQTRGLTSGTRRVAAAFEVADRQRSGGALRVADDATFSSALDLVLRRLGGADITPDDGLVGEVDGDWSLDAGGLTASAIGSALYGYRSSRSGELRIGPLTTRHEIEGTLGATADGRADLTVGPGGAALHLEGEAFVGGKVETRHLIEAGVCEVEIEGTGALGGGAGGELDAELGPDGFTFDGSFLAALGPGAGAGVSASCRPPSLDEAKRWVDDRVDDVKDLPGDVVDVVTDPVGAVRDVFDRPGSLDLDLDEIVRNGIPR